jgi:hypothetical protein
MNFFDKQNLFGGFVATGYGSNPAVGEAQRARFFRGQEQQALQSERAFREAQANIGLAGLGDVAEAGKRAYTVGRETEEFNRLKMAAEGQKYKSQMAFQPQMDIIRGNILERMSGQLGLGSQQAGGMGGGFGSGFPQIGTMGGPQPAQSFQGGMSRSGFGSLGMQSYGSSSMGGSSLTPSWMQSYQSPQFPRY